jgi:FtsZ-binding cell division protein ZapB
MKKIILIFLIFQTNVSISQSKKVQIEILKEKNDSLEKVLQKERTFYLNYIAQLNSNIDKLETENGSFKKEIQDVNNKINQKKSENTQLKEELRDSIDYYKNKINTTNQFYDMFLYEQGIISHSYGVSMPIAEDGIYEIGNLKIFTNSILLNPESQEGHDFFYKTSSRYYLLQDNAYLPVELEDCFNSKRNEILSIITKVIKEILENEDELDPCSLVKKHVKLPIHFENLLFYADINEEQYCFQFAESSLCGGTTEVCFSKDEILQYLK